MTPREQRIAELEADIEKLKDGIYRATLSAALYAEWSKLLRDLETELTRLTLQRWPRCSRRMRRLGMSCR
jgi:hypothetical protein